MNYLSIGLFSLLLFQTIRSAEVLIKKDDNKALPLKGNRPGGANLWSDEAVTRGPQNGGFADDSGNEIRRPIGQWEQPQLPLTQSQPFLPNDEQSFPSVGFEDKARPDSLIKPPEKSRERGWNSWNSPSLSLESENDWSNSWNEPSLLPLPQQSWGNEGNGIGKPCCGGKNNWGLPSLPDQSNNWNEPKGPELLPPPSISDNDQDNDNDRGWGESKWSASQNGMSNSIGKQEKGRGGPSNQWGTQQNNNNNNNNNDYNDNKAVCNCDDRSNPQNKYGQPDQTIRRPNYPNYPASPSYIPSRPARPQKQQVWNQFENLPWSSWERGLKDKSKLKDTDTSAKVGDTSGKIEEDQESSVTEIPTHTEPYE